MLRRSIALVVFLIAAYIAIRARQGDIGMLSPAVLICAIVIAIVAFAGIVFNLPFARRYPPEGFGMSRSLGLGVGSIGILIFAAVPIFIAARGVYTGVLPALGSGPDVTFANSPMQFLGIFFCGWSVAWVFLGCSSRLGEQMQGSRAGMATLKHYAQVRFFFVTQTKNTLQKQMPRLHVNQCSIFFGEWVVLA